MRDYSFGNFLHELRVRRGLSQFQLGMLVGVSNKAVSKWENGSAKPQSRILYKLSEVLGITVDELLACKYRSTENRNIKGVFAMKKALWKKAGEELAKLYGDVSGNAAGNVLGNAAAGVLPMAVANRYFSEYAELKNTDQIIYFEFLSRMAAEARRSGGHMRIHGGIGASFVAFLIGASEVNPLRPHYYCPDCHRIHFAEGVSCGWDLPARKCSCGRELIRDGHNIPFETLRPIICQAAHYDISVSQNFYQAAKEMIADYFQGNKVVTLTKEEPGIRTYIIPDAELPDLENGQELPFEGNYDRLKKHPSITLIQNEELDAWGQLEEETGISFEKVPFTDKKIFDAFLDGDTQGIPEFGAEFTQTMIAESSPESFHDLIKIPGLCHGTGVWKENGQKLVKAGRSIGSLIAYRDDVFHCIQEKMKPENGSGTGYAWHVMEDVRRGVYAKKGMPEETRRQLLELGVEEWLIESFEKIQYLFPKAHGTLFVKHAMILMWYKINYLEAFGKIVLKGN